MKFYQLPLILFFLNFCSLLKVNGANIKDSVKVIKFNQEASSLKFTNPLEGIKIANKAFELATLINYKKGIAESYRIKGLNYSYLSNTIDSTSFYYYKALEIFKKNNFKEGHARCLNNLGSMFLNTDQKKSLFYFKKSLEIATKIELKDLIAGCNLNIGTLYITKKQYKDAEQYLLKGMIYFKKLNNKIGLSSAYQNLGTVSYYLNDYDKTIDYAKASLAISEKENLKNISLTSYELLGHAFLKLNKFLECEQVAKFGLSVSENLNNQKANYDFKMLLYELESKKQNHKQALKYLKEVHSLDSIEYQKNLANIVKLNEEQIKNAEIQKQYEVGLERQKNNRILFMAAIIVSVLSAVIIVILIRSKRKTEKSNQELLALNKEFLRQKEDLDRINLKLEEIIAERTKDLLSKNQKLSEYSYHLSHQVRGPVATLKGLIMLSQDNLIEEKECIVQMKKCVDDIDEQIMDINIALHDPSRHGLKNPNQDSGNL
ncbi:tetratricopeptide repeat protein [Pedobacter glucosidilyticus]|uniref:tetratricopeptide repeat protein n=1 Tax=Pedobacter glucosidilyticus TaxID=1122941 RepID=UPI0026E92DC6|nr:tetratricopeptide repeat protein [Pedobacter glucosidilyticus]